MWNDVQMVNFMVELINVDLVTLVIILSECFMDMFTYNYQIKTNILAWIKIYQAI